MARPEPAAADVMRGRAGPSGGWQGTQAGRKCSMGHSKKTKGGGGVMYEKPTIRYVN